MYNMNISLFGFNISVEILILIGILYLIIVLHTVCGCCNVHGIMESLTNMGTDMKTDMSNNNLAMDMSSNYMPGQTSTSSFAGIAGKKEGFTGANINFGESSRYNLNYDKQIDTNKWMQPNMTVVKGQQLSSGVTNMLNRPQQPVPLPEGEMLLFANTEFKPECCPNTYSTSTGCACMTTEQYNYLVTRSGNNVPYSEY